MPAPPEAPTPQPASGLPISYGQASDPGRDPAKAVNEDSCGYAPTRHGKLFVVCDGMGGHLGGQQASDAAIRTVFETVSAAPVGTVAARAMREAVALAGHKVFAIGGAPSNEQRPGATCVAVLIHGPQAEIAHVGDSRAYHLRAGRIARLTRDHSMVQEMVDSGMLTAEEAVGHPDSNMITRALGMSPTVEVELRPDPLDLLVGDVLLLCTDGLTDMMTDADILEVVDAQLADRGAQSTCDALVALANERGGYDNITVQIVQVLGGDASAGETIAQTPAEAPAASQPAGAPPRSPKVSGTVVQPPAFADIYEAPTIVRPPKEAVSTTVPEPPAELAVAEVPGAEPPPVAPAPAPIPSAPTAAPVSPVGASPPPIAPQPAYDTLLDEAATRTPLVPVVLAMGGVILLLVMLLIWALVYR